MTRIHFCPQCGAPLEEKTIEGKPRLGCSNQGCGYVFWDNPLPVVAAIVEYEGNILLAHNARWPQGMYALITGFLEKGETPEAAVLREVKEELNLEGEIAEFAGNYAFFQANQLLVVFHVKARGEIRLGEELDDYRLIPPEKVRAWPFGTGPAVRDWQVRHGFAR
jgi:NADH pyrophosphatase NudC (nudix superfamily)